MIEGSGRSLYQKGVRYLVGMEEEAAVVGLNAQGSAVVGPIVLTVPAGADESNILQFRAVVPIPGTNDFFALFAGLAKASPVQVIIERVSLNEAKVEQFPVIGLSQIDHPNLVNIDSLLLRRVGEDWELVGITAYNNTSQTSENPSSQVALVVTLDDKFQVLKFTISST